MTSTLFTVVILSPAADVPDMAATGRGALGVCKARIIPGNEGTILLAAGGARVTILPGVTVGEGTVIAAGSVVTSDCEANSVYAGVPAVKKGPVVESVTAEKVGLMP